MSFPTPSATWNAPVAHAPSGPTTAYGCSRAGQRFDPDGAAGMGGMAWTDAPPCAGERPRDPLSSTHRQELEEASAIDPAVIAERGYRTLLPGHRDELVMQGIVLRSTDSLPGLLLPMFRATGERISAQFKPANPITIKGKAVKYLSPKGQTTRIDVHPRNRDRVRDLSVPLWITEGIKKSDSVTSQGRCVACSAPGFLDSGLTVFASMLPRPARRSHVAPERGFDSGTSLASTARCTSA